MFLKVETHYTIYRPKYSYEFIANDFKNGVWVKNGFPAYIRNKIRK